MAHLWPAGPTILSWNDLARESAFQQASLAVVGNAGYLTELDLGDRIESFDLVLRMNNFRVQGYERHVGQKTDVFFTTFHHDVDLSNRDLAAARFVATSVPYNRLKCRWLGLQHRHASFIAAGLQAIKRRAAFVPPTAYFLRMRRRIGRYPSTGAMAILLALDFLLPVCREIFITGFSFFQGQGHYFQPGPVAPRNHDPRREMIHLRSIVQPHVQAGRVHLDERMSEQLGFFAGRRRVA